MRGWLALLGVCVAVWMLVLTVMWFSHPHTRPVPQPEQFSCAQILAEDQATDSGGEIAPVCGATPYPVTVSGDGS